MTLVALTNSISPSTVERATADSDPYERETQLNSFAHNFDDHDHALGKNLGVRRLQTTVAPAAAGEVRVNGDTLQWWGATAGAIQSALTTTQTITGATLGDPIVRDAILFAEQGTALASDASITRTAAGRLQLDTTLGVGVAPAAWDAAAPAIQLGQGASLRGDAASPYAWLASNLVLAPGASVRTLVAGAGAAVDFPSGTLRVLTTASAAAGAAVTPQVRLAVNNAGTLTVTPDAGQPGLIVTIGGTSLQVLATAGTDSQISTIGSLELNPGSAYVTPVIDSYIALGHSARRYAAVWATNGTIQTSSGDAKENLRDFDADDALDAVRVLRLRRFDYRRPEGQEGDEDPVQAAIRKNQIGFVSEEAPALFTLGDDRSVSPQQTAVLGVAGVKALLAKLDAHEVRLDALEAGDERRGHAYVLERAAATAPGTTVRRHAVPLGR